MSAPNISLLNATYSAVAGVTLPKSGGGTATFPWVEGSETKTQNGTYDVTTLAQLVVNVSGGGGGLTYETGTYSPTTNIARPTINFSNAHTEMPSFVMIADATGTDATTNNSNYACTISVFTSFVGGGVPSSSTTSCRYGSVAYVYRSSSNPTQTVTGISSLTGTSSSSMPYWVTNTGFIPSSASTSRYWRTGRTYKWIAIW